MNFIKPLFVLVLTVFAFSPALADEGKSVSYSLKKQGRVHFQDKTQDQIAAQDTPDAVHPADIEPAAGGFEPEERNNETSLSERIRLPRKN
jgi:transcriptional regulator GlxA family with amidase domain